MSSKETLFSKLSEGPENAEQVSVQTDPSAGIVEVELEGTVVELDPDEARSFGEELEADARDKGWYHAGQTKPLIEEIEDAAADVE